MWLSGLGGVLQTERSPVQFLVRAGPWVAGQLPVEGMKEATAQCFSPSLPFPFSKNKYIESLRKDFVNERCQLRNSKL